MEGLWKNVSPCGSTMLQELTTDRIVAESDLSRQLGTLRYLLGLRSARQRAEAARERAVKLEEGAGMAGWCHLQIISLTSKVL